MSTEEHEKLAAEQDWSRSGARPSRRDPEDEEPSKADLDADWRRGGPGPVAGDAGGSKCVSSWSSVLLCALCIIIIIIFVVVAVAVMVLSRLSVLISLSCVSVRVCLLLGRGGEELDWDELRHR